MQAEAEACYDEIARQAEQPHRVEMRLRDQLHALERAIAEGKQAMIEGWTFASPTQVASTG